MQSSIRQVSSGAAPAAELRQPQAETQAPWSSVRSADTTDVPHLQAELPFKSKPKQQAPRKNPTLDQKRAVKFREPAEKKAASLVHALSAIRNAKLVKRREQHNRRQKVRRLCLGMSFPLQHQLSGLERQC